MTTQAKGNYFVAVFVAFLLIMTAWGNAWVMLVGSLVGLLVGIALLRKEFLQRGPLLVAIFACVVAFIVAWLLS